MTTEKNSASLQSLLRFALPLGTHLVAGEADTEINWAVTIRAQPPALPDIYGGELALLSMDILRGFGSRITLSEVVESLAEIGAAGVAVVGDVSQSTVSIANERQIALLALPDGSGLAGIERAVNKLILNQVAQLTERAVEIQRQLTRLAAENRDLKSLLQVIARSTAKPVVIHDDAGVINAQVYPTMGRGGISGRSLMQNVPYGEFQKWLETEAPNSQGVIANSPIGYTTALTVEKRVTAYLSLVAKDEALDDFDRLVLSYAADVCSIELAKTRAIETAVEQARGDWVQMWLSGTSAGDDLLAARAQQAGFDLQTIYVVVVYRAITENGQNLPLESLIPLVRDDMARRQIEGAVGQYVDMIVALYPIDNLSQANRVRISIDELREQLATRTPSGLVAAGMSRPCEGLNTLREAYREAKDALSIAYELGEFEQTTFYGDLKLYQLLLALKEYNLVHMGRFHEETLGPLVEHDERKQSELIRTLTGFFEANGNLAQAAKDLDVHRNTLVYRLERIAELTELDLDDADNRLILHLALKIQRVLATVSGRILG
jgi:purine catabolism regulator